MNLNPVLIIVVVVLLAVAWLVWRRRQAANRGRSVPSGRGVVQPAQSSLPPAQPAWMPPRYAAPQSSVPEGPSLRVGINVIAPQGDGWLVSWHAVADGQVPVAVQWGAPEIIWGADDTVTLRYAWDDTGEAAAFQAPETRLCQPGEIISRSAVVSPAAAGRALDGARLAVAVGYGAAAEHADACQDRAAYLAWQKVAVSSPRIVPAR